MNLCHKVSKWRTFVERAILHVKIKFKLMKVEWSLVGMTDGSGSTGGQTVFKSLGGSTVRKRVVPVNRRSVKQMAARNRTGTNAQAWGGLSEANRQTWIAGAPNFPVVKKGVTHILRGNTLYTRFNNNLIWAGQTIIPACPLPVAMPVVSLTSVTANQTTPALTVAFSVTTIPTGFTAMLRATKPYPPGRYNITNKFTTVGPATVASSSANILSAYEANVGTMITGYKVSVELSLINNTTGQKAPLSIVETTIL
jgi:hypothetical protein